MKAFGDSPLLEKKQATAACLKERPDQKKAKKKAS